MEMATRCPERGRPPRPVIIGGAIAIIEPHSGVGTGTPAEKLSPRSAGWRPMVGEMWHGGVSAFAHVENAIATPSAGAPAAR